MVAMGCGGYRSDLTAGIAAKHLTQRLAALSLRRVSLYLARKARFVPATDLPWYAACYFGSRIHRLFSREGRVGLWGPQLGDMAERPLDEVCALQWRRRV